jgi:predicted enzyme related to lactoylglutathione lyase
MPTITQPRFVIAVPDLQMSASFYRDVLGFKVHASADPGWMFFESAGCSIMAGHCPDAIPASALGDHAYFAYLNVLGIDSYYKSVLEAGAKLTKQLRDEPWGQREFGVVTVDGHRIMFGESL